MNGKLKVSIGIQDGDTLGGINIASSMTLDVGTIVQTGTDSLAKDETLMPMNTLSTSTDPPYNQKGAFMFIKNNSENGYLEVKTYISTAEATGSATFLTTQRLYAYEFTWLNLASPDASNTTAPRTVQVINKTNELIQVEYALFSREKITGPTNPKEIKKVVGLPDMNNIYDAQGNFRNGNVDVSDDPVQSPTY